ncbi:hypothetical protein PRIPAC_80807 [Pristionchus pacificus]|uniref:G protein-coupled receptor n=1 Tax=Pristionchus pacificus TaxID=54126 RepID=A0A2A6C3L5_PRIPA|nr:hypothetical protein PRIPAC_80807 [Pristionchus pacificus]|eukprot:PDM72832.1 G protein-coupled receptor [Pristionchus pacificus]
MIDFRTVNLLAINFWKISESVSFCVGFALLCVSMAMLYIGIIYCAWTMNFTIKRATISGNLKRKHVKALRILIAQALNPFVFIYGPFILIFAASLIGLNWHFPEKLADILIHLFPLNNALIILTMTDEYKNTVLRRAHRPSGSDRSPVPSRTIRADCNITSLVRI